MDAHHLAPAAWLVDNLDLIPSGGRVLDVAAGRGRHAWFLAGRGFRVHAIDKVPLPPAVALAPQAQSAITTEAVDLEVGEPSLGQRCYDAVIVFNYLHRPLMPAIVEAVAPGGVLIYETFTARQAERGRPRNPAFLLCDGELPGLVAPLRVLRAREGEYDGQFVSSVVAARD